MDTKACNICHIEKPIEEFPWKNIIRRKRQAVCKTCTAKRSADWYENNKERHLENVHERKRKMRDEAREYVWNYLKTHPCVLCGESDPIVLEFHHIGDKEIAISELAYGGHPIERIVEELSRCQVLCANCHRRLTMKERGWFRGRK